MSIKLKLLCALAMVFGMLNVASAGYDVHCAGAQDPYSKFAPCNTCPCPDYPQVYFPLPSP